MRKSHRMIVAAGTLAVLVVAYIVLLNAPPGGGTEQAEEREDIFVTGFERERVRAVTLRQDEESVTIVREGDTWRLEGHDDLQLKQSALEDIVYAVSRLRAERLIAESPDDPASFGLVDPSVRAEVVLDDGGTVVLLLGNQAPSGYAYYVQKEGEEAVYTISGVHGKYLSYTVDDLRDKELPAIDRQSITYLMLRSGNDVIEIREAADEELYENTMGGYALTRPYRVVRGVDSQNVGQLLQGIPQFSVKEFIEDEAADLEQYGLDAAFNELHVRDREGNELRILFGAEKDGDTVYARLADERQVFTVEKSSLDFFATTPFELVGKFALIIGIDDVSGFDVIASEETYRARIDRTETGEEDDTTVEENYFVQNRPVEEDAFKEFYQRAIGLLVDAENPGPRAGEPEVSIVYHLRENPEETVRVDFVPYNRDFFSVYRGGVSEFLISRKQVEDLLRTARDML